MEKVIRGVLDEVFEERQRQLRKWGEQDHPSGTGHEVQFFGFSFSEVATYIKRFNDEHDNPYWSTILLEEVLEALSEEEGTPELRQELIQVAAVAVAAIENMDARKNEDSL